MTDCAGRAQVKARVSRETFERLDTYAMRLKTWQGAINLIARDSLPSLWTRHFLDSLQLLDIAPHRPGRWLDLGSGGGFPVLVCAIAAAEIAPDLHFVAIESDLRKCAFLRETARITQTQLDVLSRRIEDAPPQQADIITARALAPLSRLCTLALPHLGPGGVCLFPKGRSHKTEFDDLQAAWRFKHRLHPSQTDQDAAIYELGELARA